MVRFLVIFLIGEDLPIYAYEIKLQGSHVANLPSHEDPSTNLESSLLSSYEDPSTDIESSHEDPSTNLESSFHSSSISFSLRRSFAFRPKDDVIFFII
ncbi:hypothetical protein Tco_1036246 [Tanacetum coccineum]